MPPKRRVESNDSANDASNRQGDIVFGFPQSGYRFYYKAFTFDDNIEGETKFEILSHFDFNGNCLCLKTTDGNRNNETKSGNHLFTQQNIRKDSFDRFGDDLSELILNFLPLKEKFKFQCLCKQWQRLVLKNQLRLTIVELGTKTQRFDSIRELIVSDNRCRNANTVDALRLDQILKKCPKISEINIEFEKDDETDLLNCSIHGKVLDVMTSSGISLKKLTICSNIKYLSKDVMKKFGQMFGQTLTQMRFQYIYDKQIKSLFSSENNFPNLQKLDITDIQRELNEDLIKYFGDKQLFPKLTHLKYTFHGFNNCLMSDQNLWKLTTIDVVFDTEICPELIASGVDRALKQLSQLKALEVFVVKIYTENTTVSAIDDGMISMAKNCPKLKKLDFIMDSIVLKKKLFYVFSRFKALEFCEISVEYNEELTDYGSIESFRNCSGLRVLNLYLYNICDNHLVDIDIHIPNLSNFHVKSKTGITDLTLNCLKNLKNLKVLELHTYEDEKTLLEITDSGISEMVKNCPKLRSLLLFSRLRNECLDKSIEQMIENAKNNPKIIHFFGINGVIKSLKHMSIKHRSNAKTTLVLPQNFKIIDFPNYKELHSMDIFCNRKPPEMHRITSMSARRPTPR